MSKLNEDMPHCARYESIDALLIGAGRGGLAMIQVFRHYDWLRLTGVVDIDSRALGMELARTMGIKTYGSPESAVSEFRGDLIIDVTGDASLTPKLLDMRVNDDIDIITGKAAKVLYDLVSDQIRDQEQIHNKAMQLELFKAMLNISKQLESESEQDSLLDRGMQSSAKLIVAHKAIAIDCLTEDPNIVGGIGFDDTPTNIDGNLVNDLLETVRSKTGQICVELPASVTLPGIEGSFEMVVPIYLEGMLCYMMLFQIPLPVTDETEKMLQTLVAHLELALSAHRRFKTLEEMAYRDPLTELYNRRYFDDRLKEELARTRRLKNADLAVMFMDLDHFKELNDTLGHAIGDRVLKTVAELLNNKFRAYDVFARYGGDEFVAILPGTTPETLEIISNRVLGALDECGMTEIEQARQQFKFGLSIGACLVHAGSDVSAEELLRQADQALYAAKESGRGKAKTIVL